MSHNKAKEFTEISKEDQTKFLEDTVFSNAGVSEESDRRVWDGNGGYDENVPGYLQKLMFYTNNLKPSWTHEMINLGFDILNDANKDNEDISPRAYPLASKCLFNCLGEYPIINKKVCTIGSISPWLETILLYADASVDVLDYNTPVLKDINRPLSVISETKDNIYDVVVSYSSVEHSGLGRYGDDIDPDADFKIMSKIYDMLKPNGFLWLAVPLGSNNKIEWNHHRIYGKYRLLKLIYKFIL